jgi:hypothetical protein
MEKLTFRPVVCLNCGSNFKKNGSPVIEILGDEISSYPGGLSKGEIICGNCGEKHFFKVFENKLTIERVAVPIGYTGLTDKIFEPLTGAKSKQEKLSYLNALLSQLRDAEAKNEHTKIIDICNNNTIFNFNDPVISNFDDPIELNIELSLRKYLYDSYRRIGKNDKAAEQLKNVAMISALLKSSIKGTINKPEFISSRYKIQYQRYIIGSALLLLYLVIIGNIFTTNLIKGNGTIFYAFILAIVFLPIVLIAMNYLLSDWNVLKSWKLKRVKRKPILSYFSWLFGWYFIMLFLRGSTRGELLAILGIIFLSLSIYLYIGREVK